MDQAYLEFTWAQFVLLSKKLISYIFIYVNDIMCWIFLHDVEKQE